jgi:hypothetical protein
MFFLLFIYVDQSQQPQRLLDPILFTLAISHCKFCETTVSDDLTMNRRTILPGTSTDNAAQHQNYELQQTLTILPGLSYNLTFWARSEDPYGCEFFSLLGGYYIASNEFTSYSGQGW